MQDYYYFQVFRRTLIQFFDAFNNIKIARYTPDGKNIEKYVEVPIKHSVKEKHYYWLHERKDDEMLPMITAYVASIDWATDRTVNGFFEICTAQEGSVYQKILHPCPYNLMITMNIWALHMVDIDQIIEQILPFFCPHIFIRVRLDEIDIEYDVKVVFRSATPEVSHEMADEEFRVINYTLDFEVQTWFFKPSTESKLIENICATYSLSQQALAESLTSSGSCGCSGTPAVSGSPQLCLSGGIIDGELAVKYGLYEP